MGKLAVALIVSSWAIPISIIVNRIVPEAYMDEIFHIPQAQQYCKGNFSSWDPMITTPPGLYSLSLAHVASLFPGVYAVRGSSSWFFELCSTSILRSTNILLAVLCSVLMYDILTCVRPNLGERKATFLSIVLALYPLHWFFTFLYYTDVASLTLVLAMYLSCLKKRYFFSALMGAFAVFIRQTNVVWVLFVACVGVIDVASPRLKEESETVDLRVIGDERLKPVSNYRVAAVGNLRRRKPSMENNNNPVYVRNTSMVKNSNPTLDRSPSLIINTRGLHDEIRTICLKSWQIKWRLLLSFSPFFMVLVGFAAFVRWNGSVVLGAKEAHAMSPHFAQLMYFSLVSALAAAPLHFSLSHIAALFRWSWKKGPLGICQWLVALIAGFFSIHSFSIAHPYLLADNRHYTFYLWRRIVNAHELVKYILVPLYIYSWFSIFRTIGKVRPRVWVLAYFLATAAVLVPSPLIEFRYYTIPFFFLMLHSSISYRSLMLMGLSYSAINAFTMIMFLCRPFQWSHEPGLQRFIW
ncbi:Dol-P-Glc:Glc(2)Man(9)GlcNAc(2)-PP-Dol alpha-1,2-glucosyltransferase [Linum perenne]